MYRADKISIVAIHGIFEHATQTWTEPESSILWLRDLLPEKLPNIRVLVFSYKAESLSVPGSATLSGEGTADRLLAHATSLISELCAERQFDKALRRPIIFICHGIGGLLAKRALAFSHSRRGRHVEHLHSIFTSTYGIIFMGTPHNGINKEILLLPQEGPANGPSQFSISLLKGSEMLSEITDQFAPLMKHFAVYNFWEMVETHYRGHQVYIVDQESAAPVWDDVEKCGISGTHSTMAKFTSHKDRNYRPVFEAISRYARSAPSSIQRRWVNEQKSLSRERQQQAEELLCPQLDFLAENDTSPENYNEWCIVPRSPSVYFTGRKKHTEEVRDMLGPIQKIRNRKNNVVVVIHGWGGSGKTQFCLKYVEDNKHRQAISEKRPYQLLTNYYRYWGVFWVDASSEEILETGFASIGAQAGRGGTMHSGIYWLSRCTKPWLLILDNADDKDLDISKYLPVGGNGHVLITTRNPNATDYATNGCRIRFRGLEPHEAINLLLRSAYPNLNPETHPATPSKYHLAEGIAMELGYLPLALAHAATTIRRNIYTLEKYLHYYLGHRQRTLSSPRVKSADDANIIATWEIPFQKIAKRGTEDHRDAVDLMHILAFMHFETLPESIFTRSWLGLAKESIPSKDSSDVLQTAWNEECPDILQMVWNEETQSRFRRAIRVLCDHSIIDHEASTLSYSMHPVIHNWARERLPISEQRQWLRCAMTILAKCISPHLEPSGRQFRATLLPHINSCLQTFRAHYRVCPETLENAAIFERFAWVYAEQCVWTTARIWQQKVVEIRLKRLGRWDSQTISAQRSLGQTLWNLFEIKPAINVQLQTLNSLRWCRHSVTEWMAWPPWKPIHTPYCIALDDLTLTLWLAGKRDFSKMTGERAVDGLTRQLGPQDPKTLNAMFNLARTYLHIGEHEKSRDLLVRVLKFQKHFFGLNHPDTLMTRNELGINLCASRINLAAAERLVANVLEARKRILGDEHAYTLWSVNDLSKVYVERGQPKKAVTMLEDTLSTARRTLGDDHVGTYMTLSNLAKAYFMAERWQDAERILKPLLEKIPQDLPDWVHNMYGYAQIKFTLGALHEAEEHCKTMLEVVETKKILAMDHPRTTAIADLLLNIYRKQRRQEDIAAIKSKFPDTDSTKNEDRYDPYAVRRGSHSRSRSRGKNKVSFAEKPHRNSDTGHLENANKPAGGISPIGPKLLARRTF